MPLSFCQDLLCPPNSNKHTSSVITDMWLSCKCRVVVLYSTNFLLCSNFWGKKQGCPEWTDTTQSWCSGIFALEETLFLQIFHPYGQGNRLPNTFFLAILLVMKNKKRIPKELRKHKTKTKGSQQGIPALASALCLGGDTPKAANKCLQEA